MKQCLRLANNHVNPNERVARQELATGVPTIAIGLTDEQLATDHLLERRLSKAACVGRSDRGWSSRRQTAFHSYRAERGTKPLVDRSPTKKCDQVWDREQKRLADWIRQAPKPIGLFARRRP